MLRQSGQERRLVTPPGAHLQHGLVPFDLQGFDHRGDRRGLGRDLVVTDRHRHVHVRQIAIFGRYEAVSAHGPHAREEARIANPGRRCSLGKAWSWHHSKRRDPWAVGPESNGPLRLIPSARPGWHMLFFDRADAAPHAQRLQHLLGEAPVVLGPRRGGVPAVSEVVRAIDGPLGRLQGRSPIGGGLTSGPIVGSPR